MLKRYRVPLLRHDAGSLHQRIVQAQKIEFSGAPLQAILHQFAQVDHADRDRGSRFGYIVNRGDRTVGVDLQAFESQKLCREVAVDREPGSGNGTGPEWVAVDSCPGRTQAIKITAQELGRCC